MSSSRGVVYTRGWVADMVLDIAGYTTNKKLWSQVIVEPSCGEGSFLRSIVRRLMESAIRDGITSASRLKKSIISFDLDPISVEKSRAVVVSELINYNISKMEAEKLAKYWVKQGDYLLSSATKCDYVVGNPPYLRAAQIEKDIRKEYCSRYSAMTMGCDIFVGFIQRGLESLKESTGVLCFICADRWMQNQYGRRLRELVAKKYHIDTIAKMHDVNVFESDVAAYPAIIRIDYGIGDIKYISCNNVFSSSDTYELFQWMNEPNSAYVGKAFSATLLKQPTGNGIIPLSSPQKVQTLINLTYKFPSLEKSGVKLGIGLATGRDEVYIVYDHDLVEPERMLPAFNMRDWRSGRRDKTCWLVNPWEADGSLVCLSDYPRLKTYFEQHKSNILSRHIAQKNVATWYRTIDKINWKIYGVPMLLFPDMATKSEPVYSDGTKYPCHNCYWLVSDKWDIKVLGGLLMSDVVELFIDALGVKMRGGTMRFQAQYLRLVHVPEPESIPEETSAQLRIAFENNDREAANKAARIAYGLEVKI